MTPITKPKSSGKSPESLGPNVDSNGIKKEPLDENMYENEEGERLEAVELERLHSIGIPVPGVEIKVDKYLAKVWLETLEVESSSPVFAQRVKAVVDRAVETVAPLWSAQQTTA